MHVLGDHNRLEAQMVDSAACCNFGCGTELALENEQRCIQVEWLKKINTFQGHKKTLWEMHVAPSGQSSLSPI